jgi:tetratricopeptide (TPR) repeat protein
MRPFFCRDPHLDSDAQAVITMMILRPSLLTPDSAAWQYDRDYSSAMAAALRVAYARISLEDAPADAYLWACGDVAALLNSPMCARQRARARLLFARAHEADGAYEEAIRSVDWALDAAAWGHVREDLVDLLLYRAKLERARLRYAAAVDDVRAALELLRERVGFDDELIDPSLRLELFAQLASYHFYTGDFPEAENVIRQARPLITRVPERALDAATITWTQARLHRLRGEPERAFSLLPQVAAIYAENAPPFSQAVLAAFTGELLMDFVECLEGSHLDRRAFLLDQARSFITTADRLACQIHHLGSQCLAELASIRWGRLRGENRERINRIELVIQFARWLDDHALLAQGFTALGDELGSQGQQSGASGCYRQTLGLLDGSEVSVLAWPARLKLAVIGA